MSRKRPNTIIGPPAEGAKYLERSKLQAELLEAIRNGEHVILTAPRRVGKSSVMIALASQEHPDLVLIYENIESDGSSREFYQRLWGLLVKQLSSQIKASKQLQQWIKGRTVSGASMDGVELQKVELDHKAELLSLVKALGKEPYKVVLMLDEFPEVLMAIRKKEGEEAALAILHTLREIRHSADFRNFSTIIAGSIGLHHVVSMLGRLTTINDMRTADVPVLTKEEGADLLELMLNGATIQLDKVARTHLLETVGYLLPYHMQLVVVAIDARSEVKGQEIVTPELIDEAANMVVSWSDKFEDWELRLNDYLPKADHEYCLAVLTRCAHGEMYTIQQAFDLSKVVVPERSYMALIQDVLCRDGYLYQEGNRLLFLAPFVRRWWVIRHPEHEIND